MWIQGAVCSGVVHAYQGPALSSVPAAIVVLTQMPSPECFVGAQERRPEPTMKKWGDASKTCVSILQDTAKHNRRGLVAFCQECWRFTDFWHIKGTIQMTKLKIDAC